MDTQSDVEACGQPGGVKKHSGNYVIESTTVGLVSPLADCGTEARYWGTGTTPRPLAAGTVVKAIMVSYTGNWLLIETAVGPRWVPRADVRLR